MKKMQFSTSMRSIPDPNPDSLGWLLPHLLSTRQIIEGRRINLLEQTPEYLGVKVIGFCQLVYRVPVFCSVFYTPGPDRLADRRPSPTTIQLY
jgi:hypothetical protein